MSFEEFTQELAATAIEFPHLKTAQLAQAILESGRGSSALFKDHKNPFGMKYRNEMSGFATSVSYTDHAGETDNYCAFASYQDAVRGYWRFIDRSPYSGWRHANETVSEYITFISYAGYVGGPHDSVPDHLKEADKERKEAYIAKVRALFAEADQRLAEAAGALPPPEGQIWQRSGVFLDVGHGQKPNGYDPGAVNSDSNTTEHYLNQITAAACAAVLSGEGVPVLVDDGKKSNYDAGKAAVGYDVFVSVHHNSVNGNAQGTEAFSHSSKGTSSDRALAAAAAKEMAHELGIRDRGRKTAAFSVLSGARDANVRVAVLVEIYFMQAQEPPNPPPSSFEDWSKRGGEALARAILDWLRTNS